MIVILNINSQKFSLNGIPYFKNFMPHVVAGKLKIVNAYDAKFELASLDNYSNYSVNGVVHLSVSSLQNALLPVLYTRDTLGGASSSLPPPFGTFEWIMRGSDHDGETPIAGDIFQGMISSTEFSDSLIWNGTGPHNNTNLVNFNILNSIEITS